MDKSDLRYEERITLDLRSLYRRYGYQHFRMSKFEEYDLYQKNKSFLVSDNIITFNDSHGRLMALKPDVTLSIVKNAGSRAGLQKYCYNENVYRMSPTSGEFKEIMQVGLECIGDIDVYAMGETIMLAAESLRLISDSYTLDISHMGYLTALLDHIGLDGRARGRVLRSISRKSVSGLEAVARDHGISDKNLERLRTLATMYGSIGECIGTLRDISVCEGTDEAVRELESVFGVISRFGSWTICLDFSIVNDMRYYNGVIFRGFVDGVPSGVLSGGRYDNLMKKFDSGAGAIGFAVYLDELEYLNTGDRSCDADVLLICTNADPGEIAEAAAAITGGGESVWVSRKEDDAIRCRRVVRLEKGGVIHG